MALKQRRDGKMWKDIFNFNFIVVISGLLYLMLFVTCEPVCYSRTSQDERNSQVKMVDCDGSDDICMRFASREDVNIGELLNSRCAYPEDHSIPPEKYTTVIPNQCVPNPCNDGICSVLDNAVSCNCEATFSFGQFCNMPIEIQFQNVTSLTIPEGSEGTKNICLGPQIPPRSVDIQFSLSASPANTDLTFTTSTSIPMGQTCTSIQFSAVTDGIGEGTETFQISLSSTNINVVNVDTNLDQFTVTVTDECSEWNQWNGSEYKGISTWQTWNESRQLCESSSSHLVTIENKEENEFVQKMVQHCCSNYYAWIGLNDIDAEGTCEWSDGTVSTYRNWREGEPDGDAWDCDCVVLLRGTREWEDHPCTHRHNAVCERSNTLR